jgi:hypothetical protein
MWALELVRRWVRGEKWDNVARLELNDGSQQPWNRQYSCAMTDRLNQAQPSKTYNSMNSSDPQPRASLSLLGSRLGF